MKRFTINGDTANWANLNVEALNTKNGTKEAVTTIPENMRLVVTIADKFNPLAPNTEDINDETSRYAFRHGRKRHYLLECNGRIVGWAAFHRVERDYRVTVELRSEDEFTVRAKSEEEAIRKAHEIAENEWGGIATVTAVEEA